MQNRDYTSLIFSHLTHKNTAFVAPRPLALWSHPFNKDENLPLQLGGMQAVLDAIYDNWQPLLHITIP